MLTRMPAAEVTDWAAYEQVTGPLGAERADLLTGILAATIANVAGSRRYTPADFLPTWDREPQRWQEQLAIVTTLNRQLDGEIREVT